MPRPLGVVVYFELIAYFNITLICNKKYHLFVTIQLIVVKFLYDSNRGHDSIVIYRIDQQNGQLTLLGFQTEGIDEPRHFNIDPSGNYCLVGNQDLNNVALFTVDPDSGLLTPTSSTLDIGKPICIKFQRNLFN